MRDEAIAAALARNDRFLQEFVEADNVCPFARRCRETGALERRVLIEERPQPPSLAEIVSELARPAYAHVEVALLILPRLALDPAGMNELAGYVRELLAKPHTFHLVAFHPDAPLDATTPHRMVSFFRRSPDPTFQLVRASVLDALRGGSENTVYRDPATIDLERVLDEPEKVSLSTRITEANHRTAHQQGIEALERKLKTFRVAR